MRTFKGFIKTDMVGSECEFKFEVEDDATDAEIEHEAKEAAFDCVEWSYQEVKTNSE